MYIVFTIMKLVARAILFGIWKFRPNQIKSNQSFIYCRYIVNKVTTVDTSSFTG